MNQEIYDELKRRILFFEYSPGEMLNEKAIAAELGVSRTPIRESFLKLEWEKLVTIMPRAGIMVTKVEFLQTRDIFTIRVPLEGLIGKLAATKITTQHLSDLSKLRKKCEHIIDTSSHNDLIKIDLELRNILANAADNIPLQEMSDYLYYQTQRLWSLVFDRAVFDTFVEAEIGEIEKCLEIFSKGDPIEAEEFRKTVIINHIERISHFFYK